MTNKKFNDIVKKVTEWEKADVNFRRIRTAGDLLTALKAIGCDGATRVFWMLQKRRSERAYDLS